MKGLLFFSCFVLFACGSLKKPKGTTISGKIQLHKPYCGGARPNAELAKGTITAYPNATFVVKNEKNNDKKKGNVTKFITDENGGFSINLPKGEYYFYYIGKLTSLEDYIQNNKMNDDKMFMFLGDENAKKEHETPDFTWIQDEQNEISFVIKSRCNVGLNKLYEYIGPPAP